MLEVTIAVENKDGGDLHEVDVTVDTAAFHTVLPASLMAQLRVAPIDEERVEITNGSTEVWSIGEARIA
jgi:predicted aspartyl protease